LLGSCIVEWRVFESVFSSLLRDQQARAAAGAYCFFCAAQGAGIENFTWEWDVYNITHPPKPFACRIEDESVRTQVCAHI
jgi:hypothetical protein